MEEGRTGMGKTKDFSASFSTSNPNLPVTCRSGSEVMSAHPPPRPFIFAKKSPFSSQKCGDVHVGSG